jgi:uncharacterized protein
MIEHHLFYLALLFAGGLLAGTVDAIAGGGGLSGKLGSHFVIKKGAQFVRPIFLTVVFATIVVMFYKTWFRLIF